MALSDFFSAWNFHVALINGLPVVKVGGLPLSSLSFTVVGILFVYLLLRHKFQINDVQRKLTVSLLLLWFILGSFAFFQRLFQAKAEYNAYSDYSLEEMRELTTYNGYYGFIEFIKSNVPKSEGILLLLPEGADYFNQKTEYYLYPLRIDQNGKYIAVFHTGQRTAFDEKKGTFAYKGYDGREVILPSVKRLAVYKENEELYRITQ